MAKKIESKLDRYADTLMAMDAEKKTLEHMRLWLKEEGVVVDKSTIGRFLESGRQSQLEDKLLVQISSGARQSEAVKKEFGKNPPPELEMLIKLHQVLIMQLSTQGNANPKFLILADQMLRTVMEMVSGQTKAKFKERELALAESKFQWDAAEACLEKLPDLKAVSEKPKLTLSEKNAAIQQILFGKVAKS
jgi:hypothetical protein